jgi:preprotein translocase subunit YajC
MEALIFPALLFLVMYVALILPQQRRAKETRLLLGSLQEGDEVVTTSGIHGFINTLDEQIIWLEIADGVELKMSRSAVAGKVVDGDEGDADDDEAAVAASGLGDTDEID